MSLNRKEVEKRFKALNETEYYIEQLDIDNLQTGLFLPFSELTSLKKQILFFLGDSREHLNPVELMTLPKQAPEIAPPSLSVLISSHEDLHLCDDTEADFFFHLPDSLSATITEFLKLFDKNKKLQPWFPAVLIGDNFNDAVHFLRELKPGQIVTDNSGIAYEAHRLGIPWIAGPRLNLANSFSLLALKKNFNCTGAFISNELSRQQIRGIKKPENFKLYYTIYHPIEVMISRQCFFQQVTGCAKERVDQDCIRSCRKSATISNLKKETLFIDKKAGNYNRIYNEHNFLNTNIITDIPDLFSGFFIDLRDINTLTCVTMDKGGIVSLFDDHLKGIPGSAEKLNQAITPSSHSQYVLGI